MHYSSFSILLTLFVFTGLLSFHPSEAFLEWLWGLNSDDSPETPVVRTNGVKFEVQTTDEKFLQLKDVFENMSELDACNNIVRKICVLDPCCLSRYLQLHRQFGR
jgi:hypothetical protein